MEQDSHSEPMDPERGQRNEDLVPGPLGKELAEWSREFRTRWFSDSKKLNWSPTERRMLAALGALVYLIMAVWTFANTNDLAGRILDSDRFINWVYYYFLAAFVLLVLVALGLGRLLAFQDDRGGPIRIFLAGVALPAVVVLIAKVSLWIF